MLLEKESQTINTSPPSLYEILVETSPTLILLPKLESLINKEEPTLEDILVICSHDKSLLSKLTRRSGLWAMKSSLQKKFYLRKVWVF